jgi:SEC-C motif-containing protein
MLAADAPCPCGLAQSAKNPAARRYAQCCGPWHAGPQHLQAPDAAALMRSRYSAYVLGLADYLLATWHPDTRPASLDLSEPGLRWLGLTVRRHQRVDDTHALVEFVARSKQGGRAQRLHETSRFEWSAVAGAAARWWYVDGDLHAG